MTESELQTYIKTLPPDQAERANLILTCHRIEAGVRKLYIDIACDPLNDTMRVVELKSQIPTQELICKYNLAELDRLYAPGTEMHILLEHSLQMLDQCRCMVACNNLSRL